LTGSEFLLYLLDPFEVGGEDSPAEGVKELELALAVGKLGFAALGFVEDA
jgi:hypothetical protein